MSINSSVWDRIYKGIEDGKKAFCGPYNAQIDLTDKCNNACIGCWVHSPLLDSKEIFPEGQKELKLEEVRNIVDKLYKLGTQRIILAGSGEPLLHPDIFNIVKLIKSKKIYLNIITNATLLHRKISKLLIKTGVDLITASVWAGTHKVYTSIHPKKSRASFEQVRENLKWLTFYKKLYKSIIPCVNIYNVICSKNYHDIEAMIDFAKDVDADFIEFQLIDIIKNKTEHLALNNNIKKKIIATFEEISQRADFIRWGQNGKKPFNIYEGGINEVDFGKIWKNQNRKFCISKDEERMICLKNNSSYLKKDLSWKIPDSLSQGFMHRFIFNPKTCRNCTNLLKCFPSKKSFLDVKTLNLIEIRSFIRRISSSEIKHGLYEEQIDSIPCFIGWSYTRILSNGDVIPCCKAARHPLGSIKKHSFSEIWHSSAYSKFRFKAKYLSKKDSYFSRINCIKSCDNWIMNKGISKEIKSPPEYKYSYLKAIVHYTAKYSLKATMRKIVYNLIPKNLGDRYLEILGIYNGKYAYKGPFHIQIDLTNNCNNNCIACWCNSPLLKEKKLSGEEKKQHLPLSMVKELIDEVYSMGATEIYYSGSGEPFMHPDIMEILEYTKRKNLICHVNTNFTLANKGKIDQIIDLGVDFLTVSLWAATAETYTKTHSNRTKDNFYKIKENLIYLNENKRIKPHVKLYNVIFNMNYFEVEKMVDFAADTKAGCLEFTLADTVPGATDTLCLNRIQLSELIELCKRIKSRLARNNTTKDNKVFVFKFDQFLRRISVSNDVEEAKYDRNIIDNIPCYIGWLFARIIPNGEVHSCLKAHRIPTGSLYKNRFSEIWNSKKQFNFRKKTLIYEKKDPFFRLIGNDPHIKEAGCYKSCDDVGRNAWMHNKIKMLSAPEKLILKGASKVLRRAKMTASNNNAYKKYHKDPVFAGILHGRKAFKGPEQVVIDPTNKCNLRCISCWLYSPFLNGDRPSNEWLRKELSKNVLIRLIDDLASLGTKKVRFTGGGEPFMHKDLMAVIEYARKKDLSVALTSNFGLANKKQIKELIDLETEELAVSIWASNPEVYRKVHHEVNPAYFEKLKENLIYLKEIKENKPRVTLANVVMNCNYMDFEKMYEFALNYGADSVYFTIADVFLDQTDALLLNEDERRELLEKALKINQRNQREKNIELEFFNGFIRRISKSKIDFEKGEYDKTDIDKIPCYTGWTFSRILANGAVVPCCRGVKKVMGNINEGPFKNIWNSSKYNEFRAKAKYLHKSDPYFKEIGCIKECDNLMHNEEIHRIIEKS